MWNNAISHKNTHEFKCCAIKDGIKDNVISNKRTSENIKPNKS